MTPIVPNGKATRATEIHGVVESQRTERYQAEDSPAVWGANPPLAWGRAIPYVAFFVVMCGGLFVPRPVQLGIGAGLAVVALLTWWRHR
jgi:hypothetical protein